MAVVLGGSRATGTHRPDSDWDLGLYYRASQARVDPGDVRRLGHPGHVSALGEWGPIVNGGAWLTVAGLPVDVLFRDLDVVEAWERDAREGRFDIVAQNGCLVGAPTYVPVGELAVGEPLAGQVPRPGFPPALAARAPERWNGQASVALMFAGGHAGLGDVAACLGMLAAAVLCAAHARLAGRGEWVLNEKRLAERAGLHEAQAVLAGPAGSRDELLAAVAAVQDAIGVPALSAR